MTKDEWIWVAIRIFGIYLLVLAIISIPDAIGQLYAITQLSNGSEVTGDATEMAIILTKASLNQGVRALCQLFLFSLCAYYFLKYGRLIHRLASSESE